MKRLAVVTVALSALAAPALAHAAPPIARPNPAVYPITLDYTNPLPGPDGKPATLAPLGKAVIKASTDDASYLTFSLADDLGGFTPAPVGKLATSSGGRNVLLPGRHKTQIPLFSKSAGGKISSFTFTGTIPNPPTPPDNGKQPVPGIGPPPPVPAPTSGNTVPPANQGFGGRPGGNSNGSGGKTTPPGGGGTTTSSKPPPTTTTPGSTTTTTTTGTTTGGTTTGGGTTTTTGGGGGGGGGGACSGGSCAAGSCGVAGLQIDSSPVGCVLAISNAVPGDTASEVMTITNTSDTPYTVSLKAEGTHNSHLWQDLEMAVWDTTGAPPVTFPTLLSWTTGFHALALPTLNPGDVAHVEIDLFLPTTAGNADQGKTAVIAFHWRAQG